jgi:hypothetical protein
MIRLHINQSDIDNGKQKAGCECAIALALNRRFQSDNAVVGKRTASVAAPHKAFSLMPSAKDFVTRFDSNKAEVKPCVVCLKEFPN